ncbi:DUF6188 family protein [Leifsonia virtsii]|uniref:DUF6188 family protein n=1 Tax=Leifsonia virtsii TaxID=3035915 RepID=A0ABT8IS75_9MICO|nr:DUF6188 family protein [Leifsonia virtsii]MDN4595650.1 DUF6188 family protein [Leifsonia virtsii]
MTAAPASMPMRTREGWTLATDSDVVQVRFDHALTLVLDGSLAIRIECPLVYFDGRTERTAIPGNAESVAPLAGLYGTQVREASITADVLRVEFRGDQWLRVAPDDDFEAYSVTWDGPEEKLLIVCMPGGGLADWS